MHTLKTYTYSLSCTVTMARVETQVPEAVANGSCSMLINRDRYPFPTGSRILFWGNSHLREVLHAIACQYVNSHVL